VKAFLWIRKRNQILLTVKNKTPILGNAIPVLGMKPKWRCYVVFSKTGECSTISLRTSRQELYIDLAEHRFTLKNKGTMHILVIFQDLCSAISLKRSRWELFIDVAEHGPILKNKGVMRTLVIFQDDSMFSHIIQKVPVRAFDWGGLTHIYLEKLPKYALLSFWFHSQNRYSIPQTGGSVFTMAITA